MIDRDELRRKATNHMNRWGAGGNGGTLAMLIAFGEELLPAPAQGAGTPVAWVLPGDDTASDSGWLDARVSEWGEFTRPLYDAPQARAQGKQEPSAEDIARTICLSYGRDPDEMTSMLEMCDANNRAVPIWRVYEEQAEAILAAYSVSSTGLPAPAPHAEVREALEKLIQRHASAYVARGAAISDSIIAECKASREALLAALALPQSTERGDAA